MTDIHSHILFNLDDGSRTLEESVELLKKLKSVGFTNVIATPHYIDGSSYDKDNQKKKEAFDLLKDEIKKNNLDINIYLGNEVFISNNVIDLYKNKSIYTLNNTNYILIEFPFHHQINNLYDLIYELKHKGFQVIVAHPERYKYFIDDYELVDELRKEGVFFQSNYASVLGHYGKEEEKLLIYMLKHKYIDFLGTDIHHINRTFVIKNFKKIEKKFIKYCGKEYYNKIKENCNKLVGID